MWRNKNIKGRFIFFQTNLKFGEQKRVFSMIPGLGNAEFMRFGVMHRNTFINSPVLLNFDFSMREHPEIYFAGQITGVEGYMESAASGIIAGTALARKILGLEESATSAEVGKYILDLYGINMNSTVDDFDRAVYGGESLNAESRNTVLGIYEKLRELKKEERKTRKLRRVS